jgi:hypothetical protein
LEGALKRRFTIEVVESHRELSISLEKFKTNLLECMAGKTSTSGLRGDWVNRAECSCRNLLDQGEQFTEESGISQRGDLLGPLNASLDRVIVLAQLVEGFEMEPFEVE